MILLDSVLRHRDSLGQKLSVQVNHGVDEQSVRVAALFADLKINFNLKTNFLERKYLIYNAIEAPLHGVVELGGVVGQDVGIADIVELLVRVGARVSVQESVVAVHVGQEAVLGQGGVEVGSSAVQLDIFDLSEERSGVTVAVESLGGDLNSLSPRNFSESNVSSRSSSHAKDA